MNSLKTSKTHALSM